jgi:hypothetical protein
MTNPFQPQVLRPRQTPRFDEENHFAKAKSFRPCVCCGKSTRNRTTGACDVLCRAKDGSMVSLTIGEGQPICSTKCRDNVFREVQ